MIIILMMIKGPRYVLERSERREAAVISLVLPGQRHIWMQSFWKSTLRVSSLSAELLVIDL